MVVGGDRVTGAGAKAHPVNTVAGVAAALPLHTVAGVASLSPVGWRVLRLVKQTVRPVVTKVQEEIILTATGPRAENTIKKSISVFTPTPTKHPSIILIFSKVIFPGKKSPPEVSKKVSCNISKYSL